MTEARSKFVNISVTPELRDRLLALCEKWAKELGHNVTYADLISAGLEIIERVDQPLDEIIESYHATKRQKWKSRRG